MLSFNLPKYEVKLDRNGDKLRIWDLLRKRYVALTPEEWVRQHFTHYLLRYKNYPAALLAHEITLQLNGMTRRCDAVLYDRKVQPRMIFEYKAPHIPIDQKVFDQICRYNLVFHVDYLLVSNGRVHYCCRMNYRDQTYCFLKEIPEYGALE